MNDEQRLVRAEWEWTNMYGPAAAAAKIARVKSQIAQGIAAQSAITAEEPEHDDWDGFCASRW